VAVEGIGEIFTDRIAMLIVPDNGMNAIQIHLQFLCKAKDLGKIEKYKYDCTAHLLV
jgi:hypothetical protein